MSASHPPINRKQPPAPTSRKGLSRAKLCNNDCGNNDDNKECDDPVGGNGFSASKTIRLKNGDEVSLTDAVRDYCSLSGYFAHHPDSYRVMQAIAQGVGATVQKSPAFIDLQDAGVIRDDGSLRPPYFALVASSAIIDGPGGAVLDLPCREENVPEWQAEERRQKMVMLKAFRNSVNRILPPSDGGPSPA